jgi:hypothetical protein
MINLEEYTEWTQLYHFEAVFIFCLGRKSYCGSGYRNWKLFCCTLKNPLFSLSSIVHFFNSFPADYGFFQSVNIGTDWNSLQSLSHSKYCIKQQLTLSWPAGHIRLTYKESFQVRWDNSIPLFLHAAIYLEVSLFRWTSQNALSRETTVLYKWYCVQCCIAALHTVSHCIAFHNYFHIFICWKVNIKLSVSI